jgi:glycosyltransferase involved in cell wall biosynthesis
MKPSIHVLYEHGVDRRPFGSASIRLLRPLTHPQVRPHLQVSFGLTYEGQPVEAVILDRLWRPDISLDVAGQLLAQLRSRQVPLLYALDDSFLDLPAEKQDWAPTEERLRVVKLFLAEAAGLLVTTAALREKLSDFNANIAVAPHALDERLLPAWRQPEEKIGWRIQLARLASRLQKCPSRSLRFSAGRKIVIGYMGTFTHDDDLLLVLPALQAVARQFRGMVEFELIGVIGRPETRRLLQELPLRLVKLSPRKVAYDRFMAWFSRCLEWDIALAPLRDTPFNRCKSDIKFLDYSAIGAAGIFSRVRPYEASVSHGQTGWLAENTPEAWQAALTELIDNQPQREQLAHNAAAYLFSHRTLAVCAPQWVEAINRLLA